MAGELLAQVLLDIGRNYAEGKAEERALLRKEQELLNEHAYQKVLREERLKTEKELITFRNSEEGKQLEANLEMQGKAARKNASIQDEETLTRNAVDASGLSPEEVAKLSRKERLNLVEKATYEKTARALTNQQQTQDTLNEPKKQEAVDTVRALENTYNELMAGVGKLDNGPRILRDKDARAQQLVADKYPPDAARAGKLSNIGLREGASTAEIIAADYALKEQLTSEMKALLQNDPKALAAMRQLELVGKQLAAASENAMQLGANPYSDKYGAMPVAHQAAAEVEVPKSDGVKLPGNGAKGKPDGATAPVVDNVFTQRNQEIEDAKKLDQYGSAYFAAQKTPAQLQQQAAMESPSWLGRAVSALPFGSAISEHYVNADPVGSSLVNSDAAGAKLATLQQQQAAAQAQAEQLAPQVKPELATESSYWNQFMPQVRKNAFGQPAPDSEDAFAMMTPAQKVAWFRSHNLGANVSSAPVAETPAAVKNPYWQVKQ